MNEYTVALFFHLLGVLLFVSGIVLAGVAFESARRKQTPSEIQLLLSTRELRALLDDPLSRAANYASLIAILAVVAVMVFKP